MCSEDMNGWKLEELLETVISELKEKSKKIHDAENSHLNTILENNDKICLLLDMAKTVQEETMFLIERAQYNKDRNM